MGLLPTNQNVFSPANTTTQIPTFGSFPRPSLSGTIQPRPQFPSNVQFPTNTGLGPAGTQLQFPQQAGGGTTQPPRPQIPTQGNALPQSGLSIQDRIAQIQQNMQRNPFISGGFNKFPQTGQIPSFNNPFFTGNFPQGLSSKNI